MVMGLYNPELENVRWVNVCSTPQFCWVRTSHSRSIRRLEDISERRQFELALRESEEKYRKLVETASEGVVIMDAQHRISYINPQATQITGYKLEQVSGQLAIDFIYPEDQTEQQAQLLRANKASPADTSASSGMPMVTRSGYWSLPPH